MYKTCLVSMFIVFAKWIN